MHSVYYRNFKCCQTWFFWIRWITEAFWLFSSTSKSFCIAGRTQKMIAVIKKKTILLSFYNLGLANLTVCSVELSSLFLPCICKSNPVSWTMPFQKWGKCDVLHSSSSSSSSQNNDGPQPNNVANLKTVWKTVASAAWDKSISTVQKNKD